MADLQAALEQTRAEVAELDKQKVDLTRDCIGLQSKKQFLSRSIAKLTSSEASTRQAEEDKVNEHVKALHTINLSVETAKTKLKAILAEIETAKSELASQKDLAEAEVVRHDKIITLKQANIRDIVERKHQKGQELDQLNNQISVKRGQLSDLDEKIKQAEAETNLEIAKIRQRVVIAGEDLDKLNSELDSKVEQYDELVELVKQEQTKLDSIAKQRSDFLDYEKRVKNALKAREDALIQGEAQLTQRSRRTSVLDKLG